MGGCTAGKAPHETPFFFMILFPPLLRQKETDLFWVRRVWRNGCCRQYQELSLDGVTDTGIGRYRLHPSCGNWDETPNAPSEGTENTLSIWCFLGFELQLLEEIAHNRGRYVDLVHFAHG